MTAFGLAFAGPLQGHYWYQWLDKVSCLPVWIDYWQCIVQHHLLTMMRCGCVQTIMPLTPTK